MLYERLARGIARDSELLTIAAQSRAGQPAPNLFFAAVHYLLLHAKTVPLAAFYPSLGDHEAGFSGDSDPYLAFRAFCLDRAEALRELVATRLVQTNEVARCALLLPAFGLVARQCPARALALIEIGASAGLNLLWDRYAYHYPPDQSVGPATSGVQIRCEARGPRRPPIPADLPRVTRRVGLDLHPIDVRDPDARRWLRALVWPEHLERAAVLERALALAAANPPPMLAGDAIDLLPIVTADIEIGASLVVVHSHTVNQFTPDAQARLDRLLEELSAERDLFRVSIEWTEGPHPRLELTAYSRRHRALLAWCDPHAAWIEWLYPVEGRASLVEQRAPRASRNP